MPSFVPSSSYGGYSYLPRGYRNPRRRCNPYFFNFYRYGPRYTRRFIYEDDTDSDEGEDAPEEVVPKLLKVEKIDLQTTKNMEQHHTDNFLNEEEPKKLLIVRRGEEFVISCTFDHEYYAQNHDMSIVFQIGKDPKATKEPTLVKMKLIEDTSSKPKRKSPREWQARLISSDKNDVHIGITTSCNSIIGKWKMKIITELPNPNGKTDMYAYTPSDVIILLNPWCKDDQCYMENTSLLEEYVLNDKGCVYQGSYNAIEYKKWHFAQFEEGVLDTTLMLLNKVFGVVDSRRADVVRISRALAQITLPVKEECCAKSYLRYELMANAIKINSNDEGGVLTGNWNFDYSGGATPQSWKGSYNILKQYKDTNESVRYGQCWVFAAVLNTVCRAIGMPCRCVTNYESAHDSDGSTTIDTVRVQLEDGSTEIESTDQTWNFHVWNEVWFKRPDLPAGFDGWQAIDATPQEASGGVMTCGPASVKAIKEGYCDLPYDVKFLFAEVNGDCVTWLRKGPLEWHQTDIDKSWVGKNISTKEADGKPYPGTRDFGRIYGLNKNREDLTDRYKYLEGSMEERLAVMRARSNATTGLYREEVMISKDLSVQLKDVKDTYCGQDVPVVITVKNMNKKREPRTVAMVNVSIASIDYRGLGHTLIKKHKFEEFQLNFNEEKTLELNLTDDEYFDKLINKGVIKVTSETVCKETWRHQIHSDTFRLLTPDLNIEVLDELKVGKESNVKIFFKNPLKKPLTKCVLYLHAPRLSVLDVDNQEQIPQKDVDPNSDCVITLKVKSIRHGSSCISAYFDCRELYNIEHSINNEILA